MAEEKEKNQDTDIVFTQPDTTVSEVTSQITENIEFEKYKMKMNLFKWITGTLGIAIITMIINWGFKDRAVGMDEILKYDRYTTDLLVLNDNPVKKRMLAQFFSTVTPSEKLKEGWKEYFLEVSKDYKKFIVSDSLLRINFNKMSKDTAQMSSIQKANFTEAYEKIKRNDSILNAQTIFPEKTITTISTIPTIYLHFSNKNKMEQVIAFRKMFDNLNWKAPGIEYKEVGCDNSIRYFHDDDRELANKANGLLGNLYTLKRVNMNAPKGQLEVWINNN
jgi:hypothetical protein